MLLEEMLLDMGPAEVAPDPPAVEEMDLMV